MFRLRRPLRCALAVDDLPARIHWLMTALLWAGLVACAPWPEPRVEIPRGATRTAQAMQIVRLSEAELGIPYAYGGDTPRGFDCSGLVYYVYRRVGLKVPRDANAQRDASRPVPRHDLRPGDLVFFEILGHVQLHVGIYVGDGRFIHAPQTGQFVAYGRLDNPYWQTRFVGGGRL